MHMQINIDPDKDDATSLRVIRAMMAAALIVRGETLSGGEPSLMFTEEERKDMKDLSTLTPPAPVIVPPPPTGGGTSLADTSAAFGTPQMPPAGSPPLPPGTPPAPPGGTPGAPELDSEGLPWDARLNSREKTKTVDGKWRVKRDKNMTDEMRAAIKGQLRAALGAPPAPPAPAPIPPAPGTPPPPPGAVVHPLTFPRFMRFATLRNMAEPTFIKQTLEPTVVALGVPNLATLTQRTDLLPTLMATLGLVDDGQP